METNGRPKDDSSENGERLPSPQRYDILSPAGHGVKGMNQALITTTKALKDEWPVSEEVRAAIIDRASRIVAYPENDRVFVNASKLILAADAINVRRERTQVDAEHSEVSNRISALRLALAAKSTVQGVKSGVTIQPSPQQTAQIADNSQDRAAVPQTVELPPGRGVYDCLE